MLLRSLAKLSCFVACVPVALGQQQSSPQTPTQDDEVVNVSTRLVQTDVMVFDKQGRFVEDLKPEQFALRINGSPVPISFFEFIKAGSAEEASQLEAARRGGGGGGRDSTERATATVPTSRGRSVLFLVDDFHLSPDNFSRVRKMLLRAVESELGANDQAVITATSGQLGAQQLTSDKAALKAVIERLSLRQGVNRFHGTPPMTEYQAISIERGDQSVLDYFIEQYLKEFPDQDRGIAEFSVQRRAGDIIEQSLPFAINTLTGIENTIRAAAGLPGRKLVFFVSEGFHLENMRSDSFVRLRRITDMAARAGIVFFGLDARGLTTNFPDASSNTPSDPRLLSTLLSDSSVSQDVLYTLAADTGGRALVNNNDLNAGVRRALDETSKYYLLAWSLPTEVQSGKKPRRIEISVTGRSDLKVRTRRDLETAVAVALANAEIAANVPVPSGTPTTESKDVRNNTYPENRRVGSTAKPVESTSGAAAQFSLSDLMLIEQVYADDEDEKVVMPEGKQGDARRFARTSRLRFFTNVHNAVRDAANDNLPDLDVKLQMLRGGEMMASPALREVLIEGGTDRNRFPYAADIPLNGLTPGEYTLQVIITDRATKARATQQVNILIE